MTFTIRAFLPQIFLYVFLSCIFHSAVSDTQCTSSKLIYNEPIYFYDHFLGNYTINLSVTLSAIKSGEAGSGPPFYKRLWDDPCPAGFHETKPCVEYTVYPSDQNFSPSGIMEKIKQYTGSVPCRGGVRIIANTNSTQYVYTLDHEITFCGPYLFN